MEIQNMSWNKIYFNVQNIKENKGTSVIINMPNKSEYKGWCFYHPVKLVREEGHKGWMLSFSFTDEWNFKLYKKGKSMEISVEAMKNAFDNENYNNKETKESYCEVEEPKKVNIDIEVKSELMRNVN